MLIFQHPQYLNLLYILPALAMLYVWSVFHSRKRVGRLGNAPIIASLMPNRSTLRQHIKVSLKLLLLALIILILARPQYGTKQSKETSKGIEAVVMLDVSNSMMARDVTPSRLDRSKLLVSNLIDKMRNDKIAIGVFAGEAYPQLPITSDYASAKLFLDALNPGMVTLQGTNIGAAIRLAENSFTDNKNVGKAIILITDGENHEDGSLEAAKNAAKNGIHIYVVGIGSAQGAEIPTDSGPMTDAQGQVVHTALNEQMCRETAQAGKGLYMHLDETNHAQEELLDQLSQLKQDSSENTFTEQDEQFQAVALIALLVLILEVIVLERKNNIFKAIKPFKNRK